MSYAEELGVPGDPGRLLRDLAVDLLARELLEDLVDVHVGRAHRAHEAHRGADLPVDLAAPRLRVLTGVALEAKKVPTVADGRERTTAAAIPR